MTDPIVPKTRKENFLAKIADNPNAKNISPRTRTEKFLQEIADSEKGGPPAGGGMVVEFAWVPTNTETHVAAHYESNVPVSDIVNAIKAGTNVIFHFEEDFVNGHGFGSYGGYTSVIGISKSSSHDYAIFISGGTWASDNYLGNILSYQDINEADESEVLTWGVYID